jgi:hypothetical protein
MMQITAEEINFILYQYLQESGFTHSAYTFGKESNIIENKYRHFHIPAGMLIVFLEKALTLIHIETHYNEGDDMIVCNEPFSLLNPHHCLTIMSVKKPGGQNQGMSQNPLDSIMNADTDFKVRKFILKFSHLLIWTQKCRMSLKMIRIVGCRMWEC